MSTEIKDSVFPTTDIHTIEAGDGADLGSVFFTAVETRKNARADAAMDRGEFLAAVEAELGVIIINLADLPEVTENDEASTRFVVTHAKDREQSLWAADTDAANVMRHALRYLAAARYIAAQPKIDPAQRDALTALVLDSDDGSLSGSLSGTQVENLVNALLKSGKVEVKVND